MGDLNDPPAYPADKGCMDQRHTDASFADDFFHVENYVKNTLFPTCHFLRLWKTRLKQWKTRAEKPRMQLVENFLPFPALVLQAVIPIFCRFCQPLRERRNIDISEMI